MAKKSSSGGGHRALKTRVKTAKQRKISSTRWLERQLNDPYVQRAKKEGYRSRAAYKLIELDDRFHFLKPGKKILDLGAAPGGWTQVSAARVRSSEKAPQVIAIDLLDMPPVGGASFVQMDFLDDKAPGVLRDMLGGPVDVILSDMAPNTTGHAVTDQIRIMALLEVAFEFTREMLKPGGVFVAKVFQGGTERELLARMRKEFASVKHAKPNASRADSSEIYVVAQGFKGTVS